MVQPAAPVCSQALGTKVQLLYTVKPYSSYAVYGCPGEKPTITRQRGTARPLATLILPMGLGTNSIDIYPTLQAAYKAYPRQMHAKK